MDVVVRVHIVGSVFLWAFRGSVAAHRRLWQYRLTSLGARCGLAFNRGRIK